MSSSQPEETSTASIESRAEPEVIPGHYIIVFKPNTPHDQCDAHCIWAQELHTQRISTNAEDAEKYTGINYQYRLPDGWAGYAGSFDDAMIKELEDTDEVDYIEPDSKVYAKDVVTDNAAPSWGLARISHKAKLTPATASEYIYDSSAGEGTRVYIIDTGILEKHEDFEGRATFGHNAVPGSSNTDLNGHGTHCAGTIGGKKFGVAKKTSLIGVKVLGDNGSGSTSGVIAGLNWAAEHANTAGLLRKSVASMSLGGSYSKAMNQAVANIVSAGMTVCVAAGNESTDASKSSPASEPTAITVGSIAIDDSMSSFSNYVVDIFAPGSKITSAWIDETGGGSLSMTKTISGTSMATPHVSGLAAYLIALEGILGAKAVTVRLKALAGSGKLTGLKGESPNALAFNGISKLVKQSEEPEE